MTKAELVEKILKVKGIEGLTKKGAAAIIDEVFNSIVRAVKKDKRFSYPRFGTFTLKRNKARDGRNPQTGEKIRIKASRTIKFRAAPAVKKKL